MQTKSTTPVITANGKAFFTSDFSKKANIPIHAVKI